jgi:uncharacterized protein YlxW (UPF0749 family)
MKLARNIALTMVCIILGVMLAWQYKSINYNRNLTSFQNKRTEELMADLIKLQNENKELRNRLQELKEENLKYERYKTGSDQTAELLRNAVEKARIFAGLTDVKGKGLIVTLDNNEFATVHDEDILDVINELRAAGAQAISVNEERIVAMSEVRQVGKYIMINGKQMEAPFVIKAISDPNELERSLTIIDGVVEKLRDWQLKVTLKKSDEIIIPKVRDDGSVIKTNMLTPVEAE